MADSEGTSGTLTETIRSRILDGEFGHLGRLPSEAELGAEYGAERSPVRRALAQLSADGLVVPVPKRGWLALNLPMIRLSIVPAGSPAGLAAGWDHAVRTAGLEPATADPGRVPDPADVPGFLGAAGGSVTVLERLLTASRVPCVLVSWWWPAGLGEPGPGGEFGDAFRPQLPDQVEAALLAVGRSTPCLEWTRVWTESAVVLRCLMPASRVTLVYD
jgi:hypothetical protein